MNQFINPDSPLMRFITKIACSVYLNILWFVCCLPVVTAGASTTALFYVTLKMAKNEEGAVTNVFYHMRFENVFWTIAAAVFLVALAAYFIILMYIFPLLARFDNTVTAMFKNSILLGMRFIFCTALMCAIYFLMALVIIRVFTPAILFGEGLCALLCSYLLSNILKLCEQQNIREEPPIQI